MSSESLFVPPASAECARKCVFPEGMRVTEVPRPRAEWPSIRVCPHRGCGRAFLVRGGDIADWKPVPTVKKAPASRRKDAKPKRQRR